MRLTPERVRRLPPGTLVTVSRFDYGGNPYAITCEVVRIGRRKALRYFERGRFEVVPISDKWKYFRGANDNAD